MNNQIQKKQLTDIMHTMDDCLDEIKLALDKLQFEQVTKLITVLTEAFIAVNEFVDSDFPVAIEPIKEKIEKDRIQVNVGLEDVLASFDSHDMEVRVSSYESLKNHMFNWTGRLFDILKLHH